MLYLDDEESTASVVPPVKPTSATPSPEDSVSQHTHSDQGGAHDLLDSIPEAELPEKDAYYEQWLRVCADLENLRRRHERERVEQIQYAHGRFAKELLSVADNLERALQSVSSSNQEQEPLKGFYQGVLLTYKALEKVLTHFNVEKISALHQIFDPLHHEAMGEQEEAEVLPGTVVKVLQEGYVLKDKVLRPALVLLSKKPSTA